jgi:thiamine-phosphate pyrophosphorylase
MSRARVASHDWRLYVILDPAMCLPGVDVLEVARGALEGGARVVQLRDKASSGQVLLERARALVALCEAYDALCIINDRLDVALAAGAHGAHLGPDDLPMAAARRVAPWLVLGGSAGSVERATQLVAEGADYLGVGAIFDASASKPNASAPRGVAILTDVTRAVSCPVVGIGGVTLDNIAQVRDAGASGAAVIRAVCGQAAPAEATRALLGRWGV